MMPAIKCPGIYMLCRYAMERWVSSAESIFTFQHCEGSRDETHIVRLFWLSVFTYKTIRLTNFVVHVQYPF